MKMFSFFIMLFLTFSTWADALMNPTRYLTINGAQIAVYESSGRSGPGILLVHGNTSSAQSYRKIMKSAFAAKNKVVAIDLQGFGKSSRLAQYTAGGFANTIATVAQKLKLDKGVIVGWSLGGDLVLQAAYLLPHVKGYFLFGTAPVGVAPELPAPFLTPEESYAGAAVNYGFNPNLTPQQITDYVTAFFKPRENVPQFFIDEGLQTDPNTRLAVYLAATGQDPTFKDEINIIRHLNAPVALLLGNKDAFVRRSFLTELAPSIPTLWDGEIKMIPHSGHAIQWERPVVFIARLKQFIKDL